MSFREKFISAKCYLRSVCRQEIDNAANKSLFERDWEIFVIKRDPETGTYRSQTLCCDAAPITLDAAAACC